MATKRLLSLVLALGAAIALPGNASASNTPTHKILYTILESGDPGTTLNTGYNTMEAVQAKCAYPSCTVSMQIMSNVGVATCSDEWAIVGLVDGVSVDGGPYQADLPSSPTKYVTRNWQGEYTVSRGQHTLAFQLYVPCPVNAYQWSAHYMVTTP